MRRVRAFTLGALLESFFRSRLVEQRRASHATIASYRDALKLLLVFCSRRHRKPVSALVLGDLERDAVLDFLDHIEKDRGNSARTRNARLTAIRSFFQHVAFSDPASIAIAQRVLMIGSKRTTKPILNHLTPIEVKALLAAPNRRTTRGRRDYALLVLLCETGARVSEAIGIDSTDVRLEKPYQVLLHGKGRKDRVIPIKERTAAVLRALRDERRLDPRKSAPLFLGAHAERLTRFGVTHLLRRAVTTASRTEPTLGARRISPHTLRHTAAMNLLRSKVDLSVIRSWLGHVNINTTHHYIEADVEMKRRALQASNVTQATGKRYRPRDALLAMLENL